ncbi:MAG: CHAT domain-containing protein [Caldilineaceae bacterium]|jgi:hypothetical protein
MEINYLSLDVVIDHTDEGYLVRIRNAPTGEAVVGFQMPFNATELERLHRLLTAGEAVAATEEAHHTTLQGWGERLFRALFPGPLYSIIQSSHRFAYQERARLRVRLEVDQHMPALLMLPWEYLFDPVRKEFMALSLQSPFFRYTNLMHQILPLKVEPPLRLLVVVSSPGGYPVFDRDQAWFTILDQLDYLALEDKLILERLTKPTLFDLQRRLREKEYHLLHFIGHGSSNPLTGESALIFEDEMGRGRPVNGEHLGALLRDHFSLRLITLATSDEVRTPTANPYLTIAANLIRRGAPAVVATQSRLDAATTATFAQKFYSQIANFTPVDLAMSETRRALFHEQPTGAWGLPALFMRSTDGRLFDPLPVDRSRADPTSGQSAPSRRLWPVFGRRR